MTTLVCEPIVHAVAYCENKAFFKQSSEALIQGLLPSIDDEDEIEGEESDIEIGNEEMIASEEDQDEKKLEEDEEEEFNSEDFDNIKDDGVDDDEGFESCEASGNDSEPSIEHDVAEECDEEEGEEEEEYIFDYSLLSKFVFDFGAREDVPTRNRKFLYELSELLTEIENGSGHEGCCNHDDEDTCCN